MVPERADGSSGITEHDEHEAHEGRFQCLRATITSVQGCRSLNSRKPAYSLYITQNPLEQARLLETLLSNCTFDRGTLCPTYRKPFDLFAQGSETGDWLLRLDSNQDYTSVVRRICRRCTREMSPSVTRAMTRPGTIGPGHRTTPLRPGPSSTS